MSGPKWPKRQPGAAMVVANHDIWTVKRMNAMRNEPLTSLRRTLLVCVCGALLALPGAMLVAQPAVNRELVLRVIDELVSKAAGSGAAVLDAGEPLAVSFAAESLAGFSTFLSTG